MIPSHFYRISFSDREPDFNQEIIVVTESNDLDLTASEIDSHPNAWADKQVADMVCSQIQLHLKLKDKAPSPMRAVEEYMFGKPNGFAFIDGLLILLAIMVFLCAVWMIHTDSVLQ